MSGCGLQETKAAVRRSPGHKLHDHGIGGEGMHRGLVGVDKFAQYHSVADQAGPGIALDPFRGQDVIGPGSPEMSRPGWTSLG